jgi:hypothetical protein
MVLEDESPFPAWRQVFGDLMAAKAELDACRSTPAGDPRRAAAEARYLRAEAAYHRLAPEFTVDDDA